VKSLVGGGGGLESPQIDQYHSSNSSPSLMQMPTEEDNTKEAPLAGHAEQNANYQVYSPISS
jgi:hypothetical protein